MNYSLIMVLKDKKIYYEAAKILKQIGVNCLKINISKKSHWIKLRFTKYANSI